MIIKDVPHGVRVLRALMTKVAYWDTALIFPWDYKYGPIYIDDDVRKKEECWDGKTYPAPKDAYGYVRNCSRIEVASGDFSLVDKNDGDFMAASTHLMLGLAEVAKRVLETLYFAGSLSDDSKVARPKNQDTVGYKAAALGGKAIADRIVMETAVAVADAMERAHMEVPE